MKFILTLMFALASSIASAHATYDCSLFKTKEPKEVYRAQVVMNSEKLTVHYNSMAINFSQRVGQKTLYSGFYGELILTHSPNGFGVHAVMRNGTELNAVCIRTDER